MPINTEHPEYSAMRPVWDQAKVALAGQRAVKAAGETYLIATSGMKSRWTTGGEKSYKAYLSRARFSDIPRESLEGALGVLFGRGPIGSADEVVTNNGLTVRELARECAIALYSKGRHVLVSESPVDGGDSYIAQYAAESLINWKHDNMGRLTLAVFSENVATGDAYSHETEQQYREYTNNGVQLYNKKLERVGELLPLPGGKIPVVILGSTDCTPGCDRAPIERIIECALAAYRNSADYQQGMFLTAQPTLYFAGCTSEQYTANAEAGQGAGVSWYMGEDASGKAGYAEFSGAGIKALKESEAAELQAAAEYSVKLTHINGVEAAASKALRDSAQKSALSMLADSLAIGINAALSKLAALSVTPRAFEEFGLQLQTTAQAESTMVTAIGREINIGNFPAVVGYNYAVNSNLFSGTHKEWLDQTETGGHENAE